MIVLDTNVISELLRSQPDLHVLEWVNNQPERVLFVTSISEADLRYGVEILPAGGRRERLLDEVDGLIREDFFGRILPFDSASARAYASIAASRRASGHPINHADCQIAAIARCRGASVATRDIGDFQGAGIDLINPWEDRA